MLGHGARLNCSQALETLLFSDSEGGLKGACLLFSRDALSFPEMTSLGSLNGIPNNMLQTNLFSLLPLRALFKCWSLKTRPLMMTLITVDFCHPES